MLEEANDSGDSPSHARGVCWGFDLAPSTCRGTPIGTTSRVFSRKFCVSCRHLLKVKSELVRALTKEQTYVFVNSRRGGMWNIPSPRGGGGDYRVVNNTKDCIGPPVAIFSSSPPDTDFPALPRGWIDPDGFVHFSVSRGTLVPSITIKKRPKPEGSPPPLSDRRVGVCLRSYTSTRSPQTDQQETDNGNCGVAPSTNDEQIVEGNPDPVHVQLDDEDPDNTGASRTVQEEEPDDTDKEDAYTYATRRMMNNRRSAAKSRERKRAYVAELEHKVQELQTIVDDLRTENTKLTALASNDVPTFTFDLDSLLL